MYVYLFFVSCFFFKQKTAYEMRISDWSSDVCSSDLYTDDAMAAGDRDWGIIGVSLRSGDVAAQLGPQDGLYTVSTRSAVGTQLRLIGAVQKVLVAADDGPAVIDAIAAPATNIVRFPVTEKGDRESDG